MEKFKKRNTGELAQSMAAHFSSLKNAIIYSVVLAFLSALPLAALIIGAMRFKECTIQSMIPIWLLVVGAVGVGGCSLLITMVKSINLLNNVLNMSIINIFLFSDHL